MKGYREEAKESMQFVYKGNVEDEFDRMAETINSLCCRNDANVDDNDVDDFSHASFYTNTGSPSEPTVDDIGAIHSRDDATASLSEISSDEPKLFGRRYRPIMILGLTLLVAQQFSGQPSVLAYSRVLFSAAGWEGHASVVTVIIMGVTSSVTVALVDRLGRKILLLAGCAIMATALAALTYGFWGWDEENGGDLTALQQQLVLWSMFVYIAGYQVGYGPITWTVLSEIYPSEIRGTAMALSVEVNFLAKFLCQLTFPMVQDLLGWGCTFIAFIIIVSVSFLFIVWKVPETKGMSLEEIQVQMRGMRGAGGFQNSVKRIKTLEMSQEKTNPLLHNEETDHYPTTSHGLTPIV